MCLYCEPMHDTVESKDMTAVQYLDSRFFVDAVLQRPLQWLVTNDACSIFGVEPVNIDFNQVETADFDRGIETFLVHQFQRLR